MPKVRKMNCRRKKVLKGLETLTRESRWAHWLKVEIQRQASRSPKGRGKRVSAATRHKAYVRDGGCAKCQGSDTMSLHHIIPKRLGGTNHLDNLITLCEWCHGDWNSLEARDYFKWFQFFIWLKEERE